MFIGLVEQQNYSRKRAKTAEEKSKISRGLKAYWQNHGGKTVALGAGAIGLGLAAKKGQSLYKKKLIGDFKRLKRNESSKRGQQKLISEIDPLSYADTFNIPPDEAKKRVSDSLHQASKEYLDAASKVSDFKLKHKRKNKKKK